MRRHWWKGIAFVVLAPAFLALVGLIVMFLWNALVPSLFAGPVLGFWQAVGLLVLCRLLFGGFRRGPHRWGPDRAWRERWHRMSPEERERFREGMKRWKEMHRDEHREFRRRVRGCWRGEDAGPDASQSGGEVK